MRRLGRRFSQIHADFCFFFICVYLRKSASYLLVSHQSHPPGPMSIDLGIWQPGGQCKFKQFSRSVSSADRERAIVTGEGVPRKDWLNEFKSKIRQPAPNEVAHHDAS